MLWIIQKNLYIENQRGNLCAALARLGIEHHLVNLGANRELDIDPGIDLNQPIITNGSVMLSRIAKERHWVPG